MGKKYDKLKEPVIKSLDAYDYVNSPLLYYFFKIKKKFNLINDRTLRY